jgi:hypothetical protein
LQSGTFLPDALVHFWMTLDNWHTKSFLLWKISNSMDTLLVGDVLQDAIAKYGIPEILTLARVANIQVIIIQIF